MAEKSERDYIERIIEVIRKALRGDYSTRIDPSGNNDDLNALADAVHEVVDHVRGRITECRQMENALRESTEKYRQLQASIPGMVYLYELHPDGSDSYPYVSSASRHLFNIEPDALMRDSTLLSALIHPDDKARRDESIRKSAETLQPWKAELRHIVNGEVRWYDCIARPELQLNGDVLWSGIILEITERRRAEDALRESEAKYRRLYETMRDAFFSVDMNGRILETNHAYQAMLGYSAEELCRLTCRGLTPEKWHALEVSVRERVLTEGYSEVYEKEYRRRDGTVFPVEMRSFLMRDGAGRPAGMWAIVRDITERKRADDERARLEAQLIQAQKMESIGRLAGGVAHDFNNMLSVILGSADLIKARLPANDPLLKDIMAIEKAAGHSRDVTRQLLAFSRKQIIEPKPVNLNDLIGDTEKTLARLIGEDLELKFYPGTPLWKIRFDPAQLDQILLNLAANARDAMPKGGNLTIETANIHLDDDFCREYLGCKPGDYILLEVSDDGVGMDEETLSHAFEPFFTTKEVGRGTGLGLATVYGIVKQNGGFITIYSEPGRGTAVKIYLPRIAEEEEPIERTEEAPAAPPSGKVLLVEDDEMVRDITKDILEEIGYTVLVAETPLRAVSLCEQKDNSIDLVITDVVMPGLSGRQLRDRIETLRPGIKVLFMSGYPSDIIAQHGILEEGVHFIQKPFKIKDLARKVQEMIVER